MKEYMKKHQTLEPVPEAITDRTAFPFVGDNHGTSGPVRTSKYQCGMKSLCGKIDMIRF